jgi:DNA-binding transcriptional LysR family regulator
LFRQSFPAVEISLEVLNRASLIDALLSNRVDLAVMGAVPDDALVEIEPFAYNPLVLIAAPNHRLAGRADVSIKELGREHFLLREPGSGTRSSLEATLKEVGVPLQISMQVGNNSAIKQGVAAGLGIALISRVALDMELETHRLVILDVEGFPIVRQWRIVHLKDKYLSPTALNFKAFLMQHADRRLRRKQPD